MTDENRVTEAVAYAPYGKMEEVLAGSADQEMREKFTGKEFDTFLKRRTTVIRPEINRLLPIARPV